MGLKISLFRESSIELPLICFAHLINGRYKFFLLVSAAVFSVQNSL